MDPDLSKNPEDWILVEDSIGINLANCFGRVPKRTLTSFDLLYSRGTHKYALEVQPPFFVGWFTKNNFFIVRFIIIQKEPAFFKMVIDFQGMVMKTCGLLVPRGLLVPKLC